MTTKAASILVGPDTPIGVTQGSKNNSALPSQMISDLKAMGIRWLRWQPYANSIELSKGVYTWGNLDSVVSACNAAGVNLMLTVLFPPTWGQNSSGIPTPSWTLAFAQAMCSRYDGNHGHGQIQAVELGNEDYAFSDDPGDLIATMKYCYPTLKASYPSLIIGPGAAIHRNTSLIQTWFNTLWSAAGNFDYANFHYYCQNNNSSDPSVGGSSFSSFPGLISIMQSAASKAGYPNFPIWITETGWPVNTNGGYAAQYVVSPQTQSNYEKYELDYMSANVPNGKLWIYCLGYADYGVPSTGIGHSQGMSLYQTSYSGNPLPAYTMVQNYSKSWGGGSSTGTNAKDVAARAGVRSGSATSIWDIGCRASVQVARTLDIKDIACRAPISGAIYDFFIRANQSQWGNSTGGDNWIQAGGSAAPSIVSNQGQITGATGLNTLRLGTKTLTNVEMLTRFSISQAGDIIGLTARDTSLTSFVRLRLTSSQLQLCQQSTASNFTALASYAFTPAGATFYWMKFRAQGVNLYGKIWQDGSAEPAGWQLTATTTVTGAGQVGLTATLGASVDVATFTSFQATTATTNVVASLAGQHDIAARARIQGRTSTVKDDIACRARIVDLSQVTITTYAARRGPLQRRFPKS